MSDEQLEEIEMEKEAAIQYAEWSKHNKSKRAKLKLNYALVSDVRISGISLQDAPKFVDAFVEAANYEGRPMTEAELEQLNEDGVFIHDCVTAQIY